MERKRDRLKIVHDILYAVKEKDGKLRPTHLMYKSNLSFHAMQDYVGELVSKGFLEEQVSKKKVKTYKITPAGSNFLLKYAEIRDFVDSFGV